MQGTMYRVNQFVCTRHWKLKSIHKDSRCKLIKQLRKFRFESHLLSSEAFEFEVKLRPTVSRPVCLGVRRPSGTRDQFYFLLEIFLDSCEFVISLRPFWREDGSVIYCTIASGPCQSIATDMCRLSLMWEVPTHSWFEVPQNSWPYFTLSSAPPPTWRARFPYLYPPRNRVAQLYPRALGSLMSLLTTPRAAVEVF
jgi:hypothetical protein